MEGIQVSSERKWQAKEERESVEVGVMRNGTHIKDSLLPWTPLRSFWNGGIEACERSVSLWLLGLPPSPQRVRATVIAEFEIVAVLMEVRITETGFTAPKIDPDLFSII